MTQLDIGSAHRTCTHCHIALPYRRMFLLRKRWWCSIRCFRKHT